MKLLGFHKERFFGEKRGAGAPLFWKGGISFVLILLVLLSMVGCQGKTDSSKEQVTSNATLPAASRTQAVPLDQHVAASKTMPADSSGRTTKAASEDPFVTAIQDAPKGSSVGQNASKGGAETQAQQKKTKPATKQTGEKGSAVSKEGIYTSKEEVALYLHRYGHLPGNYITKKAAMEKGWESSKGNLSAVAPGKSIGGDGFGNREGLLPSKKGRTWKECDIGYDGGYRGGERIVFSNDGEIYYSKDHYKNFELLYGTGE